MARKKSASYFDSYFKESHSSYSSSECHYEGCPNPGLYPAPKSSKDLYSYIFFCLEHIQIYNTSWNYYKDMHEDDILAQMTSDINWRRPTWPFGKKHEHTLNSSFVPEIDELFQNPSRPFVPFATNILTAKERKLLEIFSLDYPFTQEILQKQYRALVRKYHPDLNRGNKKYEEKIKIINEAYQNLKKMCVTL